MSDSPAVVTIDALTAAGIIPDILPSTLTTPLLALPITYPLNNTHSFLGSPLPPHLASPTPLYTIPPSLPSTSLYTLLAFDPDAPSRRNPSSRSFIHHLLVNIDATKAGGVTHVEYHPPCPPQGSGRHRYVFLLYRQGAEVDVARLPRYGMMGRRRRTPADVEAALREAGAGEVELVAVQWFESEWEAWVDEFLIAQYGWIVVPMLWLMRFRI